MSKEKLKIKDIYIYILTSNDILMKGENHILSE